MSCVRNSLAYSPKTITADEATIVAAEEFGDGLWAFTLATRDSDDRWLASVALGTVTEWADDGSIDTVEIGARGVRFEVNGPSFETRDEANDYLETGEERLLEDIIKSLRFSVDSEAS